MRNLSLLSVIGAVDIFLGILTIQHRDASMGWYLCAFGAFLVVAGSLRWNNA